MNDPANIRDIAGILLRIISDRPVAEHELALAATHFAGAESPLNTRSFTQLVGVVQANLPNNPRQRELAASRRAWLRPPGVPGDIAAEQFIRSYIDALDTDALLSQAMTVGFATRLAGSPYDPVAEVGSAMGGWMLLYSVSGCGVVDTGVRRQVLPVGHLALFEPGARFSYYRHSASEEWGHYWVAFHADSDWRQWLDWPRAGPHIGHLETSEQQRPGLELAFAHLLESYSHPSVVKAALDHNLLEQVILRCRNLLPRQPGAEADPRLARAQAYIDAHFHEQFDIAAVAAAANISVSGLAHLFKAQTGVTVLAWRDEKRMMRAAQLLRNTRRAIADIAAEVGYVDAPFFTRTFKRLMGCTPRAYRQV